MGSNITKIRIIPLDWILLYNMISIQEKVCDNDVVKDDYVRRDIWACDLQRGRFDPTAFVDIMQASFYGIQAWCPFPIQVLCSIVPDQ